MADETPVELTPFERLKKDFPRFTLSNRMNTAQIIPLKDGNDLQVQPDATVEIDAADLHQIPDYTIFKLLNPKMKIIQQYGVYGDTQENTVRKDTQSTAPSTLSNPAPVAPSPTSEWVVPTGPSDPSQSSSPTTAAVADTKRSKN
jgi:hypothetical protein